MVSASSRARAPLPHPRQDSYIEPRAYSAALWPFRTTVAPSASPMARQPTSIASSLSSSSHRLPRTATAPISSLPSSSLFAFDNSFDFSDLNDMSPVPLSSGLSPTLREVLPHPVPVRAPSPPIPSDLSAASTRAVTEPHTLRDLRRVTAPLSMLDPWQYDIDFPPPSSAFSPPNRIRSKSQSPSPPSSRTMHIPPERRSLINYPPRWKRPPFLHRTFTFRRKRTADQFRPRTLIPDRLQDTVLTPEHPTVPIVHQQRFQRPSNRSRSHANNATSNTNHLQLPHLRNPNIPLRFPVIRDDSVLSDVTGDINPAFSTQSQHADLPRAASEPAIFRRSSFLASKHRLTSFWQRIWKRHRRSSACRPQPSKSPTTHTTTTTATTTTTTTTTTTCSSSPPRDAPRRSAKLFRFRRIDFRLTSRT